MILLRQIGGPAWLLARSGRAALRRGVSVRAVVEQIHGYANGSFWLVTSGMAFFGFVMVAIANAQARKVTGNLGVVGPAYFELLIREFGPLVAALLTAARAAAKDASELAAMTVTEQVEALTMSAGDPVRDLALPRLLGGLVSVPLLMVLGTASASLFAALAAAKVYGTDGMLFLDPRYLDAGDLASAGVKALLCGLYIPLAGTWRGLGARGGSAAVGEATTGGVVAAVVGCLVIDLVVAVIFFVFGA